MEKFKYHFNRKLAIYAKFFNEDCEEMFLSLTMQELNKGGAFGLTFRGNYTIKYIF
jgi:hypothetical protein